MKPSATCHQHSCERRQDCLRYTLRDKYPEAPQVVICDDRKGFVPADEAAHIRWCA